MRRFVAALCVMTAGACDGGGGGAAIDASPAIDARRIDAGGVLPCDPPQPFCTAGGDPPASLCGNGVLDRCVIMTSTCSWVVAGQEPCDGTATPTCATLGYYGGATSCESCQTLVASACEACAPDGGTCATRSGFEMRGGAAVNGTRIAVVGRSEALAAGAVAIFDGATFVTEVAVPGATHAVAVAQGWLVASATPPQLTPMAADGVLGTPVALPASATAPVMAYGAGGRVIVAWIDMTAASPWPVRAVITDPTGAIVVGETTLFSVEAPHVAATTDGTRFFVAADGNLARVATDGTFAVTTGLPSANHGVDLSWNGTRGWYTSYENGQSVQRFDATGAAVGAPEGPGILDTVAHDDTFLFLYGSVTEGFRLEARAPASVGSLVGVMPDAPATPRAQIEHLGAQIVVLWNAPRLQLKFVTPPP